MLRLIKNMIKKVLGPICRRIGSVQPDAARDVLFLSTNFLDVRRAVSNKYLSGKGIEVGALHSPLPVPGNAQVTFIDRLSKDDLRKEYPELAELPLVEVGIIDNGEKLDTIDDGSQDFVIANHFLEHCQDPISAFGNFLRVLKRGGMLYLAVPDKRYTFDKDRPVTPFEHILKDYNDGPECSRKAHCLEFAEFVDKVKGDKEIEERAVRLIETDYSIHYHVWTMKEMVEFIHSIPRYIEPDFEAALVMRNDAEVIMVLSKV